MVFPIITGSVTF